RSDPKGRDARSYWGCTEARAALSLCSVRRLFITFARGPPGVGLLLLRLTLGTVLIAHALSALGHPAPPSALVLYAIQLAVAALLIAGIFTTVTAIVAAASAICDAILYSATWQQCAAVAILSVALALLGPGAWSVDAWRYGWKQITIPKREPEDDPP